MLITIHMYGVGVTYISLVSGRATVSTIRCVSICGCSELSNEVGEESEAEERHVLR